VESQLKNRPILPVTEISGKAFDRGYQYGTKFKQVITDFTEAFLYGTDPIGFSNLSRDQAVRYAKKYVPYIEDYSPDLAEQVRGVAEGSGRLYEEIVLVNLMEERLGLIGTGCTGFAATGKATTTGEAYLGQNWDANVESVKMNSVFLLREKPDVGPDILVYTYAGNVANAGMNSNGVAISWTSVPRLEYQVGVPTYLIVAEILRQKRIGNAVEAVLRAKRAGCFQFFIGDATETYSVEATPSDVDISYSTRYIGHSNHYTSEKFRMKQDMSKLSGSTINRCNRMTRLLEENCGRIDLNICISALRDHVNYPHSICQHPMQEEKKTGVTYDSWVMIPAEKEWWFARGPPCLNEYKKYSF